MFDFDPPLASQALRVVQEIQAAGFTAYLAGGCVRDALLGKVPKDFDVATDATPDTIRKIFGMRRTLAFGASFGVIGVLGTADTPTEVATFRSDGEYSDGRRPDHVRFGTAEHDALRRDFTINGMFYDPIAGKLIDYVDGESDLRRKVVRAIGDPHQRIGEDKLRMLRAVRFAAALDFALDPATQEATRQHADQLPVVSGERIGAELRRMFATPGAPVALRLLVATELLPALWPALANFLHEDDVALADALRLVAQVQPPQFETVVAALLLLTQAPADPLVHEINQAWKLSCDEQRRIKAAIKHLPCILEADQRPWSAIQPILASRDGAAVAATAQAWATTFHLPLSGIQYALQRLSWPPDQLDPPPLITGDTLRQLGHRPSAQFRIVLQAVRDAQLDNRIVQSQEAIELAQSLLR